MVSAANKFLDALYDFLVAYFTSSSPVPSYELMDGYSSIVRAEIGIVATRYKSDLAKFQTHVSAMVRDDGGGVKWQVKAAAQKSFDNLVKTHNDFVSSLT